jgi:hypothetical protein
MITATQVKIYTNKAISEHLTALAEKLTTANIGINGAKQKDVTKLRKELLTIAVKHDKKAYELNRKAIEKKNGPVKVSS